MSWEDFDLAALVVRALLIGKWKNVEELEESISMPELIAIVKEDARREFQQRQFDAALHKGVQLDDPTQEKAPSFEEVQERARRKRIAKKHGISEEHVDLAMMGFDYEG